MNKEIKEILEFNENADYKRLSVDEIVILEHYITNLQEENKILKENAEHNDKVVDKAKWNEIIYKSRIDRAIKIYEKRTTCGYKKKRFMENKSTSDLMYDVLKGEDK